jgi:hypothetical protein
MPKPYGKGVLSARDHGGAVGSVLCHRYIGIGPGRKVIGARVRRRGLIGWMDRDILRQDSRKRGIMSALGPRPKDKVKLSRNLIVAKNGHIKVKNSGAQPAELTKGTKGVVEAVQFSTVTVTMEWQGKLTMIVDKSIWGDMFEDQSVAPVAVKLRVKRTVKIDRSIRFLTKGASVEELTKGTAAKLISSTGGRAVIALRPAGLSADLRIEMEIGTVLKVFDVI